MTIICFLGAFITFETASMSFVVSVGMGQFVSHLTDFHEICYLSMFKKSVEKIKVSLKPDKNNGYFT